MSADCQFATIGGHRNRGGQGRVSPSRVKSPTAGLRVMPPLAVVVPVPLGTPGVVSPLIVPPLSVSRPPTVSPPR